MFFPEKSKAKTSTSCPVLRRFKEPSLMQADITWRADDAEDSFLRDFFFERLKQENWPNCFEGYEEALSSQQNSGNACPLQDFNFDLKTYSVPRLRELTRSLNGWEIQGSVGSVDLQQPLKRNFNKNRLEAPKSSCYHQILRFEARLIRQVRTEGTAPQAGPLDSNDRRGVSKRRFTQRGRWGVGWNFGCQHNGRFGMIHVESCRGWIVLGHKPRCFVWLPLNFEDFEALRIV